MIWVKALVFACVLPVTVAAQNQAGPPLTPQRRAALEAQIYERFVNRVGNDMGLDAAGRARFEQHLRQAGQHRRQLAQQTVQLRRRMVLAVRDSAVTDAEIERLLREFAELRLREAQLWQRDQEALDRMLTPRQRAIFLLQWVQFNERLRDLVQQRRAPPR